MEVLVVTEICTFLNNSNRFSIKKRLIQMMNIKKEIYS
jgi:hypothetical protein